MFYVSEMNGKWERASKLQMCSKWLREVKIPFIGNSRVFSEILDPHGF